MMPQMSSHFSGHATPQPVQYGAAALNPQYAMAQAQAQAQAAAQARAMAMAYSGHSTPHHGQMYAGMAPPAHVAGHLSGHATPGQVAYQAEIPEDLGTWEERVHPENGHKFFYNTSTGVSQYELPTWVDATDPASGRVYYFNTATRVSTYDRPSDFVPIKRLPRAAVADGGVEDPYAAGRMPTSSGPTPRGGELRTMQSQPGSGRGSRHASRPTSGRMAHASSHYSLPASRGSQIAHEVYRGASSLQPKAVGAAVGGEADTIECVAVVTLQCPPNVSHLGHGCPPRYIVNYRVKNRRRQYLVHWHATAPEDDEWFNRRDLMEE